MIRIIQNPNLKNWFSLISGEKLLDQIKGKANAVKIARKLAKSDGKMISEEYNATK